MNGMRDTWVAEILSNLLASVFRLSLPSSYCRYVSVSFEFVQHMGVAYLRIEITKDTLSDGAPLTFR